MCEVADMILESETEIWHELAKYLKPSEKQMNNNTEVILKIMCLHLLAFMREKGHHHVKITGFNHQQGFGEHTLAGVASTNTEWFQPIRTQ